jgi:hypothetical protein
VYFAKVVKTMTKLSPSLKSLLNETKCRPGPTPAPPEIQSIFSRIDAEATAKNLALWPWLAMSTATVVTMNSPESMTILFQYATASKPLSERVVVAEFMREIGLRCMGINGV